jgi:uncharacterized protein (TIGR01777 family)
MMKTLVTGCSGLVGSALVEALFRQGHTVQCLQREKKGGAKNFWATHAISEQERVFAQVVHLAGENVSSGRWSAAQKQRILDSRVVGTRELVDFISLLPQKPRVVLCASAVGFYGSRGEQIVDETGSPGSGFLAEVCRQWEKELEPLRDLGIRTVNLRFGMILSGKGGALRMMIPPFRAGVGGVIGSGGQYVSWISIGDVVGVIDFLIGNDTVRGPVNVVTPTPVTNRQLTIALGKALGRPTFFKIPALMAKIIFGQMADEMVLSSTRAIPQVLLAAGYAFQDTSLDAVLEECVKPS